MLVLPPETQCPQRSPELHPAVPIVSKYFAAEFDKVSPSRHFQQVLKQPMTKVKIHWAAIVRINQSELPQLVALINIRDAGRRHLQHQLSQRVNRTEKTYRSREIGHLF